MLYWATKRNIILENFSINGSGNGIWWSHTRNGNWIYLYMYTNNNILRNIESYNNGSYWVYLSYTSYTTLDNIDSYSNWYGVSVQQSSYFNKLNNIKSYNNNQWIYLGSADGNTLNNIKTYNNTSYWIYIYYSLIIF